MAFVAALDVLPLGVLVFAPPVFAPDPPVPFGVVFETLVGESLAAGFRDGAAPVVVWEPAFPARAGVDGALADLRAIVFLADLLLVFLGSPIVILVG